jgi:ketosteroid isomerase-like protein
MLVPALVAIVLVQSERGQAPDAERAVIERLEEEWNAAHVRGDVKALEALFADDLVVIVPGMRVMNKADSLGVFRSGRMKFDRYETAETSVRLYEMSAVVNGRLRRTRMINGAAVDDDWRFTKVYLRRSDRWQVVSFHASNTAP